MENKDRPARSWLDYLMLSLKGMAMGAADAVPGVSGGTIAFITGIYEELIHSIKQFGPSTVSYLFTHGISATWKQVNGNFLLVLLCGILLSLLTLSRVMLHWLELYPVMLWSFFFGLILASVWSLIRHIDKFSMAVLTAFTLGTITAYGITSVTPTAIDASHFYVFLSGCLAICAMILPGISGSFILLLLGMYSHILLAVKQWQFLTLGIFATGCIVGILSFSRVLNWMFNRYKTLTLALLGGFMLGSLNKVWPWKHTLETMLNRHGEHVPLVQENVLPNQYESLNHISAHTELGLTLMLFGFLLVFLVEWVGRKKE